MQWFDYEWIKVLDNLINSKLKYCEVNFRNHTDKYYAFISQEELKRLIDKYIKTRKKASSYTGKKDNLSTNV